MRARDISSVVATALAATLAMIAVSSAVGQGAAPCADPFADRDHLVAGLERDLERAADGADRAEIERQLKEARDKQEGLVATIEDYQRRASVQKDALADGGDLLAENGQVHVVEADAQVDAGDERFDSGITEE